MQEAAQFRDDVASLVQETERLLVDIKEERHLRLTAEDDVKRLTADLLSFERLPEKTDAQHLEICALRNLKDILDRDKQLLSYQIDAHVREKNDICN